MNELEKLKNDVEQVLAELRAAIDAHKSLLAATMESLSTHAALGNELQGILPRIGAAIERDRDDDPADHWKR